ncbi:MAG: class I SAM-dependent methyltransferase [Dehalococcoidales bacterium]|nr:class I SAM-dependent methyltransferase [Dehalococcoidales bacterium]
MNKRSETMTKAVQALKLLDDPMILEVGRTRSSYAAETDGFSTIYFASLLNHEGKGKLVSVDIDRDTEVICCAILNSIKQDAARVEFLNDDALNVLPSLGREHFNLIYLDGMDCHENEQESAEWHLRCFGLAHPLLVSDGLLLVDDVMDTAQPQGKGKLVIPRAIELGYEILAKEYQWLLQKKVA